MAVQGWFCFLRFAVPRAHHEHARGFSLHPTGFAHIESARRRTDKSVAGDVQEQVQNACGRCGATAYKSLMARDEAGVMKQG